MKDFTKLFVPMYVLGYSAFTLGKTIGNNASYIDNFLNSQNALEWLPYATVGAAVFTTAEYAAKPLYNYFHRKRHGKTKPIISIDRKKLGNEIYIDATIEYILNREIEFRSGSLVLKEETKGNLDRIGIVKHQEDGSYFTNTTKHMKCFVRPKKRRQRILRNYRKMKFGERVNLDDIDYIGIGLEKMESILNVKPQEGDKALMNFYRYGSSLN